MGSLVQVPSDISQVLQTRYGCSDNFQIVACSDITPSGHFGESWLLMNNDELLVAVRNDREIDLSTRIPIASITGATTESHIGVGTLDVYVDGYPSTVVRFSNSLMGEFNRVAKHIEAIVKREEPPEKHEEENRQRCERCGRLLDNWSKVCPKCINTRRIILRLGSYALPYKRLSIALVLITLFATTIELIPPYFTKIIIDDVFSPVLQGASIQSRLKLLSLLVGAFAAIRITSAGLAVLRGRLAVSLGAAITRDIRAQLYECLQRLSLSFFDKRQVGSVMSRVTQDSNHLSGFLVEGVQYYIVNLLLVIGIPIVLLGINWKLGVLVIIPTPIVVLATIASWKRLMKKFHHLWHTWSKLSAVLNDALSGIKVVKAFGQEEIEIRRFSTRNDDLYDAGVKAEQTVQLVFPTLGFLMGIGSLLVWWYGGRQVLFGDAKLGDLIAFLAYIGMFYAPVQILTRISEWMSRSLTAAERIFEVIDTVPEVADAPDAIPMPIIKGDVEFRNVDFGYDKHKPVLKDISFHVKAGEMIGLVGHSGAGKSTTINLICRFYDPTRGVILLDGVDMRKVKLADLRRQIGVVLQDPFLFNGTIAENIAYGKPGACREEIIAAAKAANAHEFIMRFPDGYDTYVRERGGRLSGGERQRIAIARAILRDPKILILDEATSSVDTETEKQLQEAIAHLVQGRTTFAIAHRLSTLRNADRLLVLENGKFVEYGTHEELLEKKGVYYKLVQLQKEISKIKAVDG